MNVNELGRRVLPKAEAIKIISAGFCNCLFAQDINDACLSHLFRFRPSAAKKIGLQRLAHTNASMYNSSTSW